MPDNDTAIEKKELQLEKVSSETIEMAIYLSIMGKSDFEISKQLSMKLADLHRLKDSGPFLELYDTILKHIENNIAGKMSQTFSMALSKIQELINSANENIALDASTKVLKLKLGNFESNANVQINVGQNNSQQPDGSSSMIADIVKRRQERGLK